MQFKRSERVSELLRHEISCMVQEIKDPRLGFVTVTAVHLTQDLRDARIYFSVFGNEEERQISTKILTNAVRSIRHQLGKKLESLKRVPTLEFVYDDTPEKAQRVDSILNQLAQERQSLPEPQDAEPSESAEQPEENKSRRQQ